MYCPRLPSEAMRWMQESLTAVARQFGYDRLPLLRRRRHPQPSNPPPPAPENSALLRRRPPAAASPAPLSNFVRPPPPPTPTTWAEAQVQHPRWFCRKIGRHNLNAMAMPVPREESRGWQSCAASSSQMQEEARVRLWRCHVQSEVKRGTRSAPQHPVGPRLSLTAAGSRSFPTGTVSGANLSADQGPPRP